MQAQRPQGLNTLDEDDGQPIQPGWLDQPPTPDRASPPARKPTPLPEGRDLPSATSANAQHRMPVSAVDHLLPEAAFSFFFFCLSLVESFGLLFFLGFSVPLAM
jgi:hypothetical protein